MGCNAWCATNRIFTIAIDNDTENTMAIRTALVVDDSRVARFTLAKLLKSRGIQVDLADSGEQALEYLKSSQPDVVFMDYMMPEMNGLETTRAITANPATASVPVVFCTGNDTAEDRRQAREHGAAKIALARAKG